MRFLGFFSSAAYRTAVLTCAVFFAAGLTTAVIGPSLPALAARIGTDIAALGGLFTAFSAGVMIAQVGVVRANRRFSQRTTLAASMLLMSAGGLLLAQGTSLLGLVVAALLSGFGFGGVLATGNTLVAQLFPKRSAAALNGINLFFGIGSIVGPALAATTNARLGMPQVALWIGAGGMAFLAPLILAGAASSSSNLPINSRSNLGAAPVRSWLFGLLLLVYTGTEIGFGAWLTLYMISSAGLEATSAALMVSGFWLAVTGGRALAAALGMRLSSHGLLRLCLAGLLLGALVLALGIGNVGVTFVGVLLFGLSCGPVFPTVIALLSSSAQGSTAASRALALGNAGALVIPALLGLLLTQAGPLAVVATLLFAAVLMFALGAAAMRPQSQTILPHDEECTAAG